MQVETKLSSFSRIATFKMKRQARRYWQIHARLKRKFLIVNLHWFIAELVRTDRTRTPWHSLPRQEHKYETKKIRTCEYKLIKSSVIAHRRVHRSRAKMHSKSYKTLMDLPVNLKIHQVVSSLTDWRFVITELDDRNQSDSSCRQASVHLLHCRLFWLV